MISVGYVYRTVVTTLRGPTCARKQRVRKKASSSSDSQLNAIAPTTIFSNYSHVQAIPGPANNIDSSEYNSP